MECGAADWKSAAAEGGSSWMSVDEEDGESNDEEIAEEDEEDNEIELIVQAGFMLVLINAIAREIMQTNFLQGKSITVSEKLLVRNSRYFADIFGSISEDVDTMVLKRQGGCLPGDEPEEEKDEEPMRNVSYATMRTVVDFFETGVLKVGEQVCTTKPLIPLMKKIERR